MCLGYRLLTSFVGFTAVSAFVSGRPASQPQGLSLLSGRGIALPLARKSRDLSKRADIPVALSNKEFLYSVDVSLGTPPQPVTLQVDTGSSDTWTFNPASCLAVTSSGGCLGGAFTGRNSATLREVHPGGFDIKYGDGSHVHGDYITDNLAMGTVIIKALEMGLAKKASGLVPYGIMGVGFDTNEAEGQYPNIIDDLVTQGFIAAHGYSLWLDDLEANTGTILFGGFDSSKFSGSLTYLPMVPASDGVYREFLVSWTSLSITDSDGTITTLTAPTHNGVGLLDLGTSITRIPSNLFNKLAAFFEVASDFSVSCGQASEDGSVNFGFAGVVISIPFSELVLEDTADTCTFGFRPDDTETIFGDTFLRSAYVVYDLDNKLIGLAQTIF